jgi:hypothetical protein
MCISVEAEGVIKRRLRNNRDEDSFEYLRNWLTFVVKVASWILYVASGRKINYFYGNFLTKIIMCILL